MTEPNTAPLAPNTTQSMRDAARRAGRSKQRAPARPAPAKAPAPAAPAPEPQPAPDSGASLPPLRVMSTEGSGAGIPAIIPLIMMMAGGYLMWFAIHYWRGTGAAVWPSYPIKSVLQGKGIPAPQPAPSASDQLLGYEQIATGAVSVPGAGLGKGASGQVIASDALRYQGAPYVWGGGSPAGWDCSGFCNYVIGHDLGMRIPGG